VIFDNPHVYILADGKQGALNPAVIELKRQFDPKGLLNPGKMRGWSARQGNLGSGGNNQCRIRGVADET
jgi:hypothetical protein